MSDSNVNSKIVDRQLQAFNDKDLDAFLDCYSDDVICRMLESEKILTEGKEQLKDTMKSSFESKLDAKSILISRINHNDLVIDHEKLENYLEGKVIKTVAIYEVKDGKISNLWSTNRTIE